MTRDNGSGASRPEDRRLSANLDQDTWDYLLAKSANGQSKTSVINQALRLLAKAERADAAGGGLTVKDSAGSEPVRVFIL